MSNGTSIASDPAFDISEEDFWSNVVIPPGVSDGSHIEAAIVHGRAGRADLAYAALAEHHRTQRAGAWEIACQFVSANKPTRVQLVAVLKTKLELGVDRPGDDMLHYRRLIGDRRVDPVVRSLNELTHRASPVVAHLILTSDRSAKPREFITNALVECYAHRRKLARSGAYPLNTMLGAHGQFHFFWHAYLALANSGGVPTDAAEAALKLIAGIGRAMWQQTQRYMVHNIFTAANHGLFFLARTMVEFRDAQTWERHALAHLDTDWDRSFFADGGHAERNWGYGSHTLARMTQLYRFAMSTGGLGACEQHFTDGLQRAYRFYAQTLGPDETCPGFGDEGLVAGGHVLDAALASGVFPTGTPRNLGVDRARSCLMQPSGFAFMRNGGARDSLFASTTFGDFAGWHSHMDALSMNLWANGEKLIEEVPRFGAYAHPLDVLWRTPEAHNQLLVDGFFYDSRPIICQDVAWHSDDAIDYFSAYHTAYRAVPPQEGWRTYHPSGDLIVRRTVLHVKKAGYLLVMDAVWDEKGGAFNRASTGWWHSPRKFKVLGPGLARTEGKAGCLLAWARPIDLRRIETGDDYTPEEAANQPHGHASGWHHLRARTWHELPYSGCIGMTTLLFPFEGKPPRVEVKPLTLKGGVTNRAEAFEVVTPAGRDVIVLNPEQIDGVALAKRRIAGRAFMKLGRRGGDVVVT